MLHQIDTKVHFIEKKKTKKKHTLNLYVEFTINRVGSRNAIVCDPKFRKMVTRLKSSFNYASLPLVMISETRASFP